MLDKHPKLLKKFLKQVMTLVLENAQKGTQPKPVNSRVLEKMPKREQDLAVGQTVKNGMCKTGQYPVAGKIPKLVKTQVLEQG